MTLRIIRAAVVLLAFSLAVGPQAAAAEGETALSGTIDWVKMEIRAVVSLDLVRAKIRFPAGRAEGEDLIRDDYSRLMRPHLLAIPIDSGSTLEDCVVRGEFSLPATDRVANEARSIPPALSPDFRQMRASYNLNMARLSAALIQHRVASPPQRALLAAPTASYSGIVIIANEELPVHGRRIKATAQPCLFPRIWDSDMNLIYDRTALDPQRASAAPAVRYAPPSAIFQNTPSGLSREVSAIAGETPLRILAQGLYGKRPTDPIINRDDALLLLSSEDNLRLLREGKVVIILADSVLEAAF